MTAWDGLDEFGLREVSEKEQLIDRAAEFCDSIGGKYVSYILLRAPNGNVATDKCVLTNAPSAWLSRYVERNYQFHDPRVKFAAHARVPFYWGYPGFADHLDKAERAILHEAQEFNLQEGYVIPTAGPEGDAGGLSFGMDARNSIVDIVLASRARMQLFAAEFHAAAVRVLLGEDLVLAPNLTAREVEVLNWAADGLSSEATAIRMGVSAPTVNYHIANSCRKLGATNKTQAVALALRHGLI